VGERSSLEGGEGRQRPPFLVRRVDALTRMKRKYQGEGKNHSVSSVGKGKKSWFPVMNEGGERGGTIKGEHRFLPRGKKERGGEKRLLLDPHGGGEVKAPKKGKEKVYLLPLTGWGSGWGREKRGSWVGEGGELES